MTFKEIQELIRLVGKSKLSEFRMKDGDFELTIRSDSYKKISNAAPVPTSVIQAAPSIMPMAAPAPVAAPTPAPAAAPAAAKKEAAPEENSNLIEIKSPMIGTFYRSSTPEKPPFIQVGSSVDKNTVVCIIEAMKLFNEIEAEVTGKIVKVLVEDAQPVEYDQPLFLIDPNG